MSSRPRHTHAPGIPCGADRKNPQLTFETVEGTGSTCRHRACRAYRSQFTTLDQLQEIKGAMTISHEEHEELPVLDHGYVRLVETWGSDERIIEAARMSTAKGFQGWGQLRCRCGATSETAHWDGDGKVSRRFNDAERSRCPIERGGAHVAMDDAEPRDEKLLRYLWENRHHTPFEMAGMTIEVQAPLFVFREWHRHRTQSYNELSARYTQMPDLHYVPSAERIRQAGQDQKNRQGSCAIELSDEDVEKIQERIRSTQTAIYDEYEIFLGAYGLAKELARLNTPVSRYSRMRAGANLRNWLHFLNLRLAPNAQWEIRQYAQAVGGIVGQFFPRTWALFVEETAK